ncbi:hypothetical protein NOVOSPHI9U_690007 [Novosphingobium sp. 9U]|nr:hypothetical protein NOVOSPHI9U_690007 [Novosphingobium sp. 9U]
MSSTAICRAMLKAAMQCAWFELSGADADAEPHAPSKMSNGSERKLLACMILVSAYSSRLEGLP